MFVRDVSVSIAASPEVVFDYVSDLSKHPEWADQKLEITLQGDSRAAGTKFSFIAHFMGASRGSGEVLEVQRPWRYAYECKDSSGTFRWTFILTSEGEGTRLTHHMETVAVPLWLRLIQRPLMWPTIGKRMVGNGLRNIKQRVETAVAGSRA